MRFQYAVIALADLIHAIGGFSINRLASLTVSQSFEKIVGQPFAVG
jgi:hypothetical protein